MASTKKKKTGTKTAAGSGGRKASKAPSKNKIVGVIVAVFVLLLIFEATSLFKTPEVEISLPAQLVGQFTGTEQTCGKFGAWDVGSVGNDKIVVTDQQNGRILFFDRTGKYLKSWGQKGEGLKDLKEPAGITSDAKGDVYFVDTWKSVIFGLDGNAKPHLSISLTQGFYGPRGVAFDGNYFYVADTGTHRIVKVSTQGEIVAAWGGTSKRGSGKDQLDNPRSLKLDAAGNCYVADYENSRVQVLDPTGKIIRTIKAGNKVTDVAIDSKNRLFVASMDGNFVKVFTLDGKYLGQLKDAKGSDAWFRTVSGMNFTPDDVLLMTANDQVTMVRVP